MNATKAGISRRAMVSGGAVALAALALLPFRRTAKAQGTKATLLARPVTRVPADPEDPAWQQAEPLEVPLSPQVVVKPRTYEAGIKSLRAQALYDADRLGFLLEWGDASQETKIGSVAAFRDAVAVEFPSEPKAGIPYFGMGQQNLAVTIYHWKADWQFGRDHDVDEQFPNMASDDYPFSGKGPGEIAEAADYAKAPGDKVFDPAWSLGNTVADRDLQARTPVEKLRAEGFGTVSPAESQDAQGKAVYKDGKWRVAISLPRAQEAFTLQAGQTLPVAFAAWDGSRKERGGEKAISTWYFLSLEKPTSALAYISPIAVVAAVALAQWFGLRWLRRRRAKAEVSGR